MSPLCGFVSLDKPAGWSSRDAVNRVQRLVKPLKAGHAGTLDPIATGVLVVAVGQATRLIDAVQSQPKTYRGVFRLGVESPSEDIESELIPRDDLPLPDETTLRAALPSFLGRISQRPPAFSALKVDGKRAYELARKGQAPELAPREIEIYELELEAYDPPEMTLLVRCGSGTYVRSLGRDIAIAAGSVCAMTALRRLAVGPFRAEESISPESLDEETLAAALRPASLALPELPTVSVSTDQANDLLLGRAVTIPEKLPPRFFAVAPDGPCVALVRDLGSGKIRAEKTLLPQDTYRA